MNFSALPQRSLRLWRGSSPTVKEGSHTVSTTKDDEPSLTVGLLPRYREVVTAFHFAVVTREIEEPT